MPKCYCKIDENLSTPHKTADHELRYSVPKGYRSMGFKQGEGLIIVRNQSWRQPQKIRH